MGRLEDFRGIEGTNFFEQDKGFQTLIGELLSDDERQQVFASLQECGPRRRSLGRAGARSQPERKPPPHHKARPRGPPRRKNRFRPVHAPAPPRGGRTWRAHTRAKRGAQVRPRLPARAQRRSLCDVRDELHGWADKVYRGAGLRVPSREILAASGIDRDAARGRSIRHGKRRRLRRGRN